MGDSLQGSEFFDAIIIGSGMSGLSAATILAKEGKRVVVLEQHYRPGGFLHRFYRRGGIEFDVGFHYFGGVEPGQVLHRYFEYLGINDRIDLIPFDPNGYDELRFPDYTFTVPSGAGFQQRLCERFPSERGAIVDYFRDVARICDGFGFYRIKPTIDAEHADRWMRASLLAFLQERFDDPKLIATLLGQSPLYGVEPVRAPVALHAMVTDSFMLNPYSVQGGGDALAGALVKRVRELGGQVQLRSCVTNIDVDSRGQVVGIRTDKGEELRAPMVLSCAHPKQTLRLLPPGALRRGYRKRVLSMEDGAATLSVFVTTKADLDHYAGRNIYRFHQWDLGKIYDNIDRPHEFVFTTVPTAREGRSKEGLHQVIGLGFMHWDRVKQWQHTQTGNRGDAYEQFKAAQAQDLLRLMTECIPELKGNIESIEAATPLTNRDFTLSEQGAAYGIHHSVEQSGRYGLRPRTRVKGLYMMGQSVLMPGVCGVTISAFHTCAQILGASYLLGKVQDNYQ